MISDTVVQKATTRHFPICIPILWARNRWVCHEGLSPDVASLLCSTLDMFGNESYIGGRASKFRALWVNNCFVVSFTDEELLVLSYYSKMTKHAGVDIHSSAISV